VALVPHDILSCKGRKQVMHRTQTGYNCDHGSLGSEYWTRNPHRPPQAPHGAQAFVHQDRAGSFAWLSP
ncbi:MAG: hypothetical protein ACREDJ_05945, partial [Methylocella sp.]